MGHFLERELSRLTERHHQMLKVCQYQVAGLLLVRVSSIAKRLERLHRVLHHDADTRDLFFHTKKP